MEEHYYTENPVSAIKEKTFASTIKNVTLTLTSVSGVFAFENKIDKASRILIESFTPSGSSVLDMGCGYGAVGLFIKAIYNRQNVYLADINSRAASYALLNARANNLDVLVRKSNLFSELRDIKFDDIVSNPPMAAGKKLVTGLINESYEHLNENGALWLVAYHNKGGSTLKKTMESMFGNIIDVFKGGGIRVYKSVR